MYSCPYCKQFLTCSEKTWFCENNHSFDVSRFGDINLLLPQQKRSRSPGDSKEMVRARHQFLSSGVYQPIADKLIEIVNARIDCSHKKFIIADAGCGEGYYLQQILQGLPIELDTSNEQLSINFVGWDISKFAVQSASKQTKDKDNVQWLTASNANIPLSDKNVDILISLFGFVVDREFWRVLHKKHLRQGYLITADVGENHLIELRQLIYPTINPYKEKRYLDNELFELLEQETITYNCTLNNEQIQQLLIMTPHLYRAQKERLEEVLLLEQLTLTVDVILRVYKAV